MRASFHRGGRRRGSAMILFMTMLPTVLIPLVGLAIDASRLYIVQAKLSAAVDGAALGAGRLLGTSANTVEIAGEFLNANFPTGFWGTSNLTPNITYTSSFTSHTITISATVNVPLLFMRLLGQGVSAAAASAVATRKETRIEVVLDRSGSMSSEITSLKNKAAEFVGKFISGYDELGLVVFSSSGVVGYPTTRPYNYSPTSAGGPDSNFETTQTGGDMLDMINDIESTGHTNMSEGLALAYLELQKADHRDQDPTRLNAIVLFTDGVPNTFSMYANDPSNNSLKSTSSCTNNPATAGTPSTQMIGFAEGNPQSGSTTGLYFLASSDSNTAASWMKGQNNNETIGPTGSNLKTAVKNCVYLNATSPTLADLKQIPPMDYWGESTNGTAYKSSPSYSSFTYNSNSPNVQSNIAIASWTATDTVAQRILADTNLNVTIYVIGYTPNGGVDTYLLKRVANTKDSTNHNAAWQTGLYVAAGDNAALEVAFQTVASAILRLAQ